MKKVLILFAAGLFCTSFVPQDDPLAACSGSVPCSACRNCTRCAHCAKRGGTCGTCRRNGLHEPVPEERSCMGPHSM
ncbi:MAG: hypothetical protein J0I17_02265 ['Candidatus Kapabacteria' thiocyanatum]|nr:hypothetical protein ['Candidatus Kapabacteria' thiocyanatum]